MSAHAWLDRAVTALEGARILFAASHYEAAVSRAYYAVFYGAKALLTSKGLTSSTHKGTQTLLNEHFVRTGILEPGYSKLFKQAEEERRVADYSGEDTPGKDVAEQIIKDAESFLIRCRELLTH